MKKILSILLMVLFFLPLAMRAQTDVVIGTGTSTTSHPFYGLYANSWCEMIYPANLITETGNITALAWNCSAVNQKVYTTVKIYLGTRSSQTYSSTSDWTPMSDLTLVYDATNVTVGAATGWQTFYLDTPFPYDGSDNLVVVVAKTMPSFSSTNYYYTSTTDACLYRGSDSDVGYATHPGTSSGNRGTYRSNITISISPASGVCAKPKNLAMSNITESSADLQWLDTNAVSWDIYLTETQSDVPDSNTVPTDYASTTSYSFSGLNSSTVYYAYVRANCGDGTTSGWKEISFMTTQVPAQIPYSCDFEDATENANWMLIGQNTNKWVFGTAVNNTSDGQTGLYVSNDNGATNNYSHTTSTSWAYRDIDFDNTYSEYNISFDFKGVGESASYDNLRVYIGTPVTPPATGSSTGACPQGAVEIGNYHNESNWIHPSINLDNTYAGVKRLYFLWWNDSSGGDSPAAAVDNLVVTGTNCGSPRNLASVTLSQTSASFSFHPASPNDYSWQTILVAHGDTIDESQAVPISDTTYEFTNLTADTPYDIYVRTDCGNEYSFWSQVLQVRTSCPDYMTIPYSETFDAYGTGSNSNYPSCWTRLTNNTSQYPYISSTNTSAPGSLYFYSSSYSSYYCCAIAPEVDVNSTPINTLSVTFKIMKSSTSTGYGAMQVGVMTNPNDISTFTPVQTYTGSEWASTNTWYDVEIPLTHYTGNGSYIALYVPSSATSYTYVDNFTVDLTPSCERPTSITAASTSSDTVNVSWVDNDGTMWDLIYGPTGFDPETSTDAMILNGLTTNSYVVDGLAAGLVYDFYVRRDCGNGDVSAWTISPATAAPYTVVMGVTGSSSVTGCGLIIVDDGGLDGNYSNSCDYYLTIYPSDPDSVVSVSGTIQAESATYDFIEIYEGVCNASTASEENKLYKSNQSSSSNVLSFGPFNSETGPLTLRFRTDGSGQYPGFIINATCVAAPTCPKPSNLASTGLTASSVSLAWTENGYASAWNVAYGPTGFIPSDTSLIEYAYDTTVTVYNLTPGVTYDFYVKADCGGDYSNWTGPVTMTPGVYNMATTGTDTLSICGGIIYDNGGANGNYSNDCQSVLVIYPSEPDSLVSISGTFAGESSYDYLEVYEGVGTTHLIDKISASLYGQSSGTTFNFGPFTSESGPLTILFHSDGSTTYAGFAVNVNCVAVPTCRQPSNFASTGITSSEVSLSWVELGDASAWNVAYGPAGFTPDATSTMENVYDTTVTIMGLTAGVTYDFYVQSDCGGDYSEWAGPLTITPGSYNMPTTGTYTISMCGGTIYDNGGANNNYTDNCHSILTINPSDPDSVVSISGTFVGEGSYDYLSVYEGTGTDESNLLQKIVSGTSGTVVPVGPFTSISGPLTILFHSDVSNNYAGFAVSVNCVAAPSCRKSTGVVPQTILVSEATIEWSTTSTNYVGFNVAIGSTADFDPDTCTNIGTATTTSYQFTGLTANTTYYVKVQTDCGGGDLADWSNVCEFTTACDAITTLPYTDNFDTYGTGSTIYPACWSKINTYSSDRPYISTTNYSAPGSMYFYAGTSGTYNIAITPQFDASIPVNTLQATFMYKGSNSSDKLIIGVISDPLDASTFTPVDTVYNSTVWDEYEVNFSGYTGNGQYIAFKNVYNSTSSAYAYLDNLYIETIPTCLRPQALATSNATTTSIDLTWTEMGTATAWNIEYGPAGFTQGQGTVVPATTNPFTVTGLNASTNYDFYVQSDCGGGDVSHWSNKASGTTVCDVVSVLPYTENFDTEAGATTTSVSVNNLPVCWDHISGTYSNYAGYPIIYSSSTYAASGTNAMRFYTYTGTTNDYGDQYAIMPPMDVATNPMTSLQVSFDARKNNTSYTAFTLIVGVMTDAANASSFVPVDTLTITDVTYDNFTVYFTDYTGTGNRIAFMAPKQTSSSYNTGYVDNIVIDVIPTCPRPQALAASNATTTSIDLSWTEVGTATAWNIEYGPAGFTQGQGTVVPATTNPFTVTGLNASTNYSFYVQANCGGGDVSTWSNVLNAGTECDIVSLPYTENFDFYAGTTYSTAGPTPLCWTTWTDNTTYPAPHVTSSGTGCYPSSGTNALTFVASSSADGVSTGASSIAILPTFTENLNTLKISFTYSMESASYGELRVGYVTNPSSPLTTFTQVAVIPSTTTVTTDSIDFSTETGIPANGNIAFYWYKEYTWYTCSIDDINVTSTNAPGPGTTCDVPTNLAVSNITTTGATASWTAGGTETAWNVQYKQTSASAWSNNINVTAPTYTFTGLTANTAYQVRVQAVCDATTSSDWTAAVSFTTLQQGQETCPAPTGLTATAVNNNDVTLTWTQEAGTANSWDVNYRVQGSTAWNTATANAVPYTLTGLQSNTDYEIQVIAHCTNGLNSDPSNTIVVHTANVGVNDYDLDHSVSVYPNPTNGSVTISHWPLAISNVSVYDVFGKLLNVIEVNDSQVTVDFGGYASGVYFARITTDNGVVTKRIVKK